MGARFGALAERARASRVWLRERGLVTLAAAVLLEVSTAAPGGRPSSRAALRALALVLLLSLALVAIAVDGLLSLLADRTRAGARATGRYVRASSIAATRAARVRAIPLTHDVRERTATAARHVRGALRQRPSAAAVEIPEDLLLDKRGRSLRGKAREARLAAIQRERERAARARTLPGRAEILLAKVRAGVAPYMRPVVAVGAALEARVLGLRAWVIRSVERASVPIASLLARVVTLLRERILGPLAARAALLWSRARLQTTPRIARLRRELAASRARAAAAARAALLAIARGIERAGELAGAIPLPRVRVPVPALSLRTLRVVTVGVTLSFVFATAIGTTGLMAQRGTVALGASTTLTIISGEVTVLAPGATAFAPAVDGDVLQAGLTIRTSASSYAILTYFEGSTVSIDPETTLVIEALQAHPDGSTVIEMRQDVGRTWHAVAKLLSPGSKYTVRTPTATASVRGTLFLVGVEEDEQGVPITSIETTEGAVAAERPPTAAAPQGEEVIVPAGFKVEAKAAEVIPVAVPAPEPQQKVTVSVAAQNTLVVDPQGRANGEKDGKIVVQTPGAKVEKKADGSISVTLPNVEGKISTVIQPTTVPTPPTGVAPQPPAPVQVITVVTEQGKAESRSEETVQPSTTAPSVTGVEVKKAADPEKPVELRKLDEAEKQSAPPAKVAEVPKPDPKPAEARKSDDDAKKADGDTGEASAKVGAAKTVGGPFAQLTTLPPLSAEELARREAERKKAEERARQEAARKDEERRAEEKKKIEELRDAEERAKRDAARLAEERKRAEERAGDERQKSDDRGREQTERREEERRSAPETSAPPAPVAAIQQIIKAIAPQGDDAPKREQDDRSRDAERQAEELRRAETKAKEEAEKAEDARRKAEERERQDSIKREEERRREAETKSAELRRAEEKAKEEADRKLEELRRLEDKARQQAAKLDEEQRRESERRLEEFRRQEERTRQQEARRIEEMRRAEDRAKEKAEERLRELRRDEERAREEQRRRDEERRQEDRRRDEERSRFVPTETLRPLPGAGSRSADEEAGSAKPRGDAVGKAGDR